MKLWQIKVVVCEALSGVSTLAASMASVVDDVLTKIDVGLGNEPERHFSDDSIAAAAEQYVASRTPPSVTESAPVKEQSANLDNLSIQEIADYMAAQSDEAAQGAFDA